MNLQSDITTLKGVGEKSATLFHKLNIYTLNDLLYNLPKDYEIFTPPQNISDIKVSEINSIKGSILSTPKLVRVKSLQILTALVKDSTGIIPLTFFNMPYLKNILSPGKIFIFRGNVINKFDYKQHTSIKVMEQPKLYKEEEYVSLLSTIQPRYSLTKGITSQAIGKAVHQVIMNCKLPEDLLPKHVLVEQNLISLKDALIKIHFPKNMEEMQLARKRLVFDEFFFFILMLKNAKKTNENVKSMYKMIETAENARFLEKLPYKLTNAQLKVINEIKEDMTSDKIMSRLVQGDVGSGKTIVAFYALLLCVSNGYQGVMMAPTEVLAKQHYENLCDLTQKYNLPFHAVLLTGSQPVSVKKEIYKQIESGNVNVVLGTHAVIQDKVIFKNLQLVITDEQHRFGVRQRETLQSKGNHPHVLVMSATPIPRTLAIILYGDLHISIIDELPAGRQQIKNCVVGPEYRPKAYSFMEKEVSQGRQVYCICPMVEEGESNSMENVIDYTLKLSEALPDSIRISYLHGKMKPLLKNQIMEDFVSGKIDILVSTTVIEVGINVPNATIMLIENAERFGLAQLHQLRGRVGRGDAQSYCIFINTSSSKESKDRLEILNHSNDGFFIASEDLRLRGPGDLCGFRQSGDLLFQIGDIYRDASILKKASDCYDKYENQKELQEILEHYTICTQSQNRNSVDFRSI